MIVPQLLHFFKIVFWDWHTFYDAENTDILIIENINPNCYDFFSDNLK